MNIYKNKGMYLLLIDYFFIIKNNPNFMLILQHEISWHIIFKFLLPISIYPSSKQNKKYASTYPAFFMGSTPSMSKPSSVSVPVYNITFNHTKLFISQIDIYNIKYKKICDIEWT